MEVALVVVTTWLGLAVLMGKYMAWRWSINRVFIIDPREALDRISLN